MQPTIKILENIRQSSTKNKDEVYTRLYRYLLRTDIYYVAYKNLYANNGAATKGVNDDTADGFSERRCRHDTGNSRQRAGFAGSKIYLRLWRNVGKQVVDHRFEVYGE